MLLLVDMMFRNFPFPPDPANATVPAECRPRFGSSTAAAVLPALEFLCAIGMLL
jgi:hypothetical protein